MATAKKADKATKKPAKASAAEVDDVLAPAAKKAGKAKADDVLEGKKGGKAPAKKAAAKAPAKKAKAKAEGVTTDDVRAVILKCKKLTSYADVAAAAGTEDMRQVRRTARAMRDAGEIEITKEGTVAFVKKV